MEELTIHIEGVVSLVAAHVTGGRAAVQCPLSLLLRKGKIRGALLGHLQRWHAALLLPPRTAGGCGGWKIRSVQERAGLGAKGGENKTANGSQGQRDGGLSSSRGPETLSCSGEEGGDPLRPSLGTGRLPSSYLTVAWFLAGPHGLSWEAAPPYFCCFAGETVRKWALFYSVKENERLSTKETGRLGVKSSCAEV